MKQALLIRAADYSTSVVEFDDDNCGLVFSKSVGGLFNRVALKSAGIDFYVNDDGIALGLDFNLWASVIATMNLDHVIELFGDVLVTGTCDRGGYTQTLEPEVLSLLRENARELASLTLRAQAGEFEE